MKILVVSTYYKPSYVYGGPVQSITNLCEGVAHAGASVSVFTTNANGSSKLEVMLRCPLNLDGVTVTYFPLDLNGLSFFYSSSLEKTIYERTSEFDIVVAETLWGHPLIPVSRACVRKQIPYIVSARGQFNTWALAKKSLKKRIYLLLLGRKLINRASAIYCTDPSEVNAVRHLNFLPQSFYIPNGIKCSDYSSATDPNLVRAKYGIPPNAIVLMFLGRLTQIKRPDIALDVLVAAQSLPQKVHLLFVGPDEEGWEKKLKDKARKLGCEEKIHFAGLLGRKGVISAFSIASLLLMPSEIQENFGNAALEALAAGVPVLSSKGIPMGNWAKKVGAGQVVQCISDTFQRAAIDLLSQPDRLMNMGKLGREMVQKEYDVSIVAQKMLKQYETIISTGSPVFENELIQE